MIPCEFPDDLYFSTPETRMIVLSDNKDRMIVSSFLWTKHWKLMDGRMDRQTDRQAIAITSHRIAMQLRCKNEGVGN